MLKSRIEDALETVKILQPFHRWDSLSQAERMQGFQRFIEVGPDKIKSDLAYLVQNLHPTDPRHKGAQALLEIVNQVWK